MKKNTRNTSLGCLFWIALILLVLVVFLFNRFNIQEVFSSTDLGNLLFPQKETQAEPSVQRETIEPKEENEEPSSREPNSSREPDTGEAEEEEPESSDNGIEITSEEESQQEEETEEPENAIIDQKIRRSTLYFVNVDDEGGITLQGVARPIYYKDSPLTETIGSLCSGLSPAELSEGLISLLPTGSTLLRAWVEGKTAYLDFNEAFRFNSFGRDGYIAQLKQVVYTATEFATVADVQILIESEKISYISGDGVYIGAPLTRNSF